MKTEFQANQALAASTLKNCLIEQAFKSKQAKAQADKLNSLSFAQRLAMQIGV